MGATAKGYPYPDPADPVANTDLAIKALAAFLEANGFKAMHAGTQVVNFAASTTANTGTVAFPVGKFTATPTIVAVCGTGTTQYLAVVTGVTAASFTATARRIDATNVTAAVNIFWVAVQLA